MKKAFTILFLLLSILQAVWAQRFDAVSPSGHTLIYNIVDGNAQVTYPNFSGHDWSGYSAPRGTLIIPESVTYNGATYSVTSIGINAFIDCSGLTSVTIPNSVTTIGSQAFRNCSGLTSVTIPNSVTTIGDRAFYNCSSLTSVTIPNFVTTIGGQTFYGCSGLTSVTIPNSVTSIEDEAFRDCSGLTSVTIPNSVTSIGISAFLHCHGLTSVTIPNSVTSIGNYAFFNCSRLTSVTIGNSVTSIGNSAFDGCHSLTSVTIGNSVTSIGISAFEGCYNVDTIFYNARNLATTNSWGVNSNCGFRPMRLRHLVIGNSVQALPSYVFYGQDGLTSLTIPSSVTSIGTKSFSDNLSINRIDYLGDINGWCGIDFGWSPLSVIHNLYINNARVTTPTISASVIKAYAFQGATCLTSVTFTNSVSEIGDSAFDGCDRIAGISSFAVTPPTVGDGAFVGVYKNIPLNVPAEGVQGYTYAYGWRDFTNIIGISTQGIDEVEGSVIRCMGDRVIVNGAVDEMISIFDITGRMIVHEKAIDGKTYPMPRSGVYMVQVGNSPAQKVVVVR